MKDLIEKYFEGKTTLEEEARLKAYFRSGETDESLKAYQPFFRFLEHENLPSLGDDFDDRLFEEIEKRDKVVPIRSGGIRFMHIVRAVAAIGAVLLAVVLLLPGEETPGEGQVAIDWSKYEITDEDLAIEETEKAFRLLSAKLNRGKEKTVEEVSKTEAVTKYLN